MRARSQITSKQTGDPPVNGSAGGAQAVHQIVEPHSDLPDYEHSEPGGDDARAGTLVSVTNPAPLLANRDTVETEMLTFLTRATEEGADGEIYQRMVDLETLAYQLADEGLFISLLPNGQPSTIPPDTSPQRILDALEELVWASVLDLLGMDDDDTPAFECTRIIVHFEMLRLQLRLSRVSASRHMLDEAEELANEAVQLADAGHFIPVPTMIQPDASAPEILAQIKQVVWRTRLDALKVVWDQAIAMARGQYHDSTAQELQGEYNRMAIEFNTQTLEPRGPDADCHRILWTYAKMRFDNNYPRANTAARLNDLYRWARDDADNRRVYTLPPPVAALGHGCEEYCEIIANDIRADRRQDMQDIWTA